jgi:hypothetical protein
VKKHIMQAMPDAPPIELAVFELLADGKVHAEYRDETWRAALEDAGIMTVESGRVTPANGRAFFDALDLAYSQSSFVFVDAR